MRMPIAAGIPKPRPPIAGLRIPSGTRAGSRSSSSGRLDGDSSITTASRREARARARRRRVRREADCAGRAPRSGSRRTGCPSTPTRAGTSGQLGADARDRREHRELGDAAMRFGRIVGHDGDPRRRGIERPRCIRVLTESRRTDHEDDVVRLEHRAQARSIRGQVSRELGMVVRESGTRAERLLPHRRAELLGDARRAIPTPRRRRRPSRPRSPAVPPKRAASTSTSIAAGSAAAARTTRARRGRVVRVSGRRVQSSIGAMTSAGPRPWSPRGTPG